MPRHRRSCKASVCAIRSGGHSSARVPAHRRAHAGYWLRADLLCAQARLHETACDQLARRANHLNPVQSLSQKYSAFVLTQITRITPPVSRRMRDARDRHERAVRCDGREWRETYAPEAYGEVVWFGRRGAGAKSRRSESFSGRRRQESRSPGRARSKP
jgi:hypothetical protein